MKRSAALVCVVCVMVVLGAVVPAPEGWAGTAPGAWGDAGKITGAAPAGPPAKGSVGAGDWARWLLARALRLPGHGQFHPDQRHPVRLAAAQPTHVPLVHPAQDPHVQDLTLGQEVTGDLPDPDDVRYYRVTATGTAPLVVLLRGDEDHRWYELTVHQGALDGPEVGTRHTAFNDIGIEVSLPTAGDHYIVVRNRWWHANSFTLVADERPVQPIALGELHTAEPLWCSGDTRHYRVTATGTAPLVVLLKDSDGVSAGRYDLTVREGALNGPEVGTRRTRWAESGVMVLSPTAGDHYVAVRKVYPDARNFTLLADERPVQPIAVGEAQADVAVWGCGDARYYRVTAGGTAPLVALLRNNTYGTCYELTVHEGALDGPQVGIRRTGSGESGVEVVSPTPGAHYIAVRYTSGFESASFTLLADERPVQPIALGEARTDQPLWGRGDVRYYRVTADGTVPMAFLLEHGGHKAITLHEGAPDGPEVGTTHDLAMDLRLAQVVSPGAGDYYAAVRHVRNLARSFGLLLYDAAVVEQLPADEAQTVTADNEPTLLHYRLDIPQEVPRLFITLQHESPAHLILTRGSDTIAAKRDPHGPLIHLANLSAGAYALTVSTDTPGTGVLRAGTSLPELELDEWAVRRIYRPWGLDWCQVQVPAGLPSLAFEVEILGTISRLDVWHDEFGGLAGWNATARMVDGRNIIRLDIPEPEEGVYHVQVMDSALVSGVESQVRDYMIRAFATTDTLVRIDNEFVRIDILPDRAAISSLVFKQGSNQELIETDRGRHLLDLGSHDPRLANHLRMGWRLADSDVQPNHAIFHFTHGSGFTSRLLLSWSAEHAQVSCEITAPEPVIINSNLAPGGAGGAAPHRWAIPREHEVLRGTFSYDPSLREVYPTDSTWGVPAERWLSFWDDGVDEVYGFTFSPDYGVQVAVDTTTHFRFLVPEGRSLISFHVRKPKPEHPYTAISSLLHGPRLRLSKNCDQPFTSPGAELTYTLTIDNEGGTDATLTRLEDALPPELAYVHGSATGGGVYDSGTHRLTWDLGTIAAGETGEQVTYKATVPSTLTYGRTIANTAGIFCAEAPTPVQATATSLVAEMAITSVSPDASENVGMVTVTISGHYMGLSPSVSLFRDGQPSIPAEVLDVAACGRQIVARLDLRDAAPGEWRLTVRRADMADIPEGSLPSTAFTVNDSVIAELGEHLWVSLEGRQQMRAGRANRVVVRVGNAGPVDLHDIFVVLRIPKQVDHALEPVMYGPEVEPPYPEGYDPALSPMGFPDGDDVIVPTWIYRVRAGSTWQCSLLITPPPVAELREVRIMAGIIPPRAGEFALTGDFQHEPENLFALADALLDALYAEGENNALSQAVQSLSSEDCPAEEYLEARQRHRERVQEHAERVQDTWTSHGWEVGLTVCAHAAAAAAWTAYGIGVIAIGWPVALTVVAGALTVYTIYRIGEYVRGEYQNIDSESPEDKYGPSGYDHPGTHPAHRRRWVAPDRTFEYQIDYWNKPDAPAPTQDCFIEDQLDESLDWSTFEFGDFGFLRWSVEVPPGQQHIEYEVDMRPDMSLVVRVIGEFDTDTGLIKWSFYSLDPYTGSYPEDPMAGFLPPITDSWYEIGWVHYRVRPKANLPTGTTITNQAWVTFDTNPPNPAPPNPDSEIPGYGPWINTIDAGPPTSSVNPLPASVPGTFTASWSGEDDEGGSGIGSYDIYVSKDDGPYERWLTGTTATSAQYEGEMDATYRFYSVARDNVGHVEPTPETYEAETTVGIPTLAHTFPEGLQMVSVPLAPEDPDPAQLGFESDRWARWNPATGNYAVYPDPYTRFDTPDATPGKGYWARFAQATEVSVAGTPPSAEDACRTTVPAGWAQIGNPRLVDVPWRITGAGALRVRRGAEEKTLAEAQAAGWCEDFAWAYRAGVGYELVHDHSVVVVGPRDRLEPWEGYWFRAHQDVQLIFPAVGSAAAAAASPAQRAEGEWSIAFIAAQEDGSRAQVVVGQAVEARQMELPPGFGSGVELSVAAGGRKLGVDLREQGEAPVWRLEATTTTPDAKVTLEWPDLSEVPHEYRPVLVDTATGRRTYMRTSHGYTYSAEAAGTRRFEVHMAPTGAGALTVTGAAAATGGGNVELRVTLSAAATVDADVLNIAGRRVGTICRAREMEAGPAVVLWNAMSDQGTRLPGGRYLIRVTARADDGQQTSVVAPLQIGR